MKQFTLEYWTDDGWYVGRLKEMPAVMSQGETLEELQAMIRDAYHLIVGDASENTFVPSERHEMAISLRNGGSWCGSLTERGCFQLITNHRSLITR